MRAVQVITARRLSQARGGLMHKIRNLIIVVLVFGCRAQPAPSGPKQVDLIGLGKETEHLVFFNYIGTDAEYHYFRTAEGNSYKVSRADWNTPRTFPRDAGMELFMTVKNGKLTVPDPDEMATLTEDNRLQMPYRKNRSAK
jgi:hypothetical protein